MRPWNRTTDHSCCDPWIGQEGLAGDWQTYVTPQRMAQVGCGAKSEIDREVALCEAPGVRRVVHRVFSLESGVDQAHHDKQCSRNRGSYCRPCAGRSITMLAFGTRH